MNRNLPLFRTIELLVPRPAGECSRWVDDMLATLPGNEALQKRLQQWDALIQGHIRAKAYPLAGGGKRESTRKTNVFTRPVGQDRELQEVAREEDAAYGRDADGEPVPRELEVDEDELVSFGVHRCYVWMHKRNLELQESRRGVEGKLRRRRRGRRQRDTTVME
eukprot:Nk52_evm17s48 gene=Nk52_evmTU17s48